MTELQYAFPAAGAERSRRWRSWVYVFGPLLGLAAVYGMFALLAPPSFRTAFNFVTILRQTAIVGAAALGMTMVIIAGRIDLSVGSIIAIVTVVIAMLLRQGYGPVSAACGGILAGAAMGVFNGSLIALLRVGPFIVTLGTLLIFRGWAHGLAKNQTVPAPHTWLIQLLASLPPEQQWMIVPPGVWGVAALGLIIAGLLRYTRLGRHLFAVGSNEQTARLCGVNVIGVTIAVYALGGALAGVAGLLQFSRLALGDPTVAAGLELDVIAAVVIGGGSLAGGQGSVVGSLVGALIMTVIRSGCNQMGLENWVQQIVTGSMIVAAVVLDRIRRGKMG